MRTGEVTRGRRRAVNTDKIEERILIQFTRDITSKNIPNSPHFHSHQFLLRVFIKKFNVRDHVYVYVL